MTDIRKYFTLSRSKAEPSAKNESVSNSKLRKRTFIESDSEDESNKATNRKKKPQLKTRKKISAISDSSEDERESEKPCVQNSKSDKKEVVSKKRSRSEVIDSSPEDISSSSKKKPIQKKLEQVHVKSKFFKETSVSDVFGSQPVKRDSSRLKEVQEKLKKSAKASKSNVKLEDEEFEAALFQLDDVGSGWIDSNTNTKSDTSKDETIEKDVENTQNFKSQVKHETTDLPEKEKSKKNAKAAVKEKSATTGSESSAKLSIKDKLKQFSALSESNKQVREEVSNKTCTQTVPDEKLLFMKPKDLSDSGYSSLSSGSQDSQNSDKNEMASPKVVDFPKKYSKCGNLSTAEKPKNLNNSKTNNASEIKDTRPSQPPPLSSDCMPWVEKYKPDCTKKIIGQQGDQSNLKKLTKWLNDWYKNNSGTKKPGYAPGGWNTDKTGSAFRAALLSGPPGVGKTTTVSLVCKELGFDVVEFNASDTRSKKLLQEEVSKLLTNTSITSLFDGKERNCSITKKHVLVMDEVDGMAGTEDRGGVQELIHLIKLTKVPIICMCNDRNHPKIRSLVNYCFDLRFQRPRVEQIKGYMKTVCFKEKLDVPADVLTNIITSSNNDVRLVLNHLSMLAADKGTDLQAAKKYVKLSPWDALRKMFSKEDHKNMSIHDKFDLFFYDYSMAPLFVQENYLMVKPLNTKTQDKIEKMRLYARAADCISIGDQVDKEIRSNSAWSLLPTQAIFASYAPGEILEGYCSGQIAFPAWLGKNSKTNKIDRLLQEIQIHTRLKISASKESVNLEYAPYLRNHILQPLIKDGSDGAKTALERLHEYDLLREDLESLSEICSWTNSNDPLSKVDSKVKAAFTRLYNKNPPVRPYSLSAPIKKNSNSDILEEEMSEDDSNEEVDAMILVKKKQLNQTDSASPSTSKINAKTSKNTNKKKKK